ncbi:LPXTG cell wall anchor domain-containing protein [Dactylosporangium sp. NPDC048998]|uniref:LPXTG cell wall anchor domain-containing protein n=1 Tax=Dactylosporangium sp. NPDC048998 TaxID=3363976 RepID=UPI0037138296
MKLRGIARIAAATAATALLIGGLGAPARAEESPSTPASSAPPPRTPGDIYLNLPDEGVYAATAPKQGCTGIDTGAAVPGTDGWLFSKPAIYFEWITYVFGFGDEKTNKLTILYMSPDGVFIDVVDGADESTLASTVAKRKASLVKKSAAGDLPQRAPDGWTGYITKDGTWIKTPAGLLLLGGFALTVPTYTDEQDVPFELVRACAPPGAAISPSASPSPSPGAGPPLPVTGTNVWVLTGAGVALIAVGVVLFIAYRRRQNVKFVA